MLCVVILQRSSSTRQGAPVGVYLPCCVCLYCRLALLQDKEHQWEYIYPVVCVSTAEELFNKTRCTSRCIPTLLCVLILQRSLSTRQGAPVGVYLPCCVCKYCRGEELFYKTRSTSRSIPISTLLRVEILQRSSSIKGAPVGVYLPCCVRKYCRGGILQDKEHQWKYIYPVVCVSTAEERFYKTRSNSRGIHTLLCVSILQRCSSTRQGAPAGVYLPCCVCKFCKGALLQEKEHQ